MIFTDKSNIFMTGNFGDEPLILSKDNLAFASVFILVRPTFRLEFRKCEGEKMSPHPLRTYESC